MGKERCYGLERVVIAGVQTIGRRRSRRAGLRRISKFRPHIFDVIVCDEAHHSAATTYKEIFEHFGLFDPNNKKLLLGVTATPFRTDDQQLVPRIYQEIIYEMPILQAIDQGWL